MHTCSQRNIEENLGRTEAGFYSEWKQKFGDEAWALDAMMKHLSFGEICAGLCQWLAEDQAAPRAAALLRGWVDEGWIAAVETT